jgi:hypothetical protein
MATRRRNFRDGMTSWLVTSGPFWLGLITVSVWVYVVSKEESFDISLFLLRRT